MPPKIEQEIIKNIVSLYVIDKINPRDISKLLGISKQTIYFYLKKENIIEKRQTKDFNEKLKNEAVRLYKLGNSYFSISRTINIPETTLKRYLKTMSLSGNYDMTSKINSDTERNIIYYHSIG